MNRQTAREAIVESVRSDWGSPGASITRTLAI